MQKPIKYSVVPPSATAKRTGGSVVGVHKDRHKADTFALSSTLKSKTLEKASDSTYSSAQDSALNTPADEKN